MAPAVAQDDAATYMEASTFNLQREAPCEGSASVLGIGTAVPPTVHLQSEYPDFFFNITNSNDKPELKKKFGRICKLALLWNLAK
jgi:hypothetical protein